MTNEIVKQFKWRTQQDEFLLPKNMGTRHLYHTLRMIYNHTVPAVDRIPPFKHYSFGPFYTTEYIREAVYHLGIELSTRDIRLDWYNNLIKMFLRSKLDQSKLENRSGN